MLVLEPQKRYTIDQIKRHSWMVEEAPRLLPSTGGDGKAEPNEQIIQLMQNLGIDSGPIREVNTMQFILLFNVNNFTLFIHTIDLRIFQSLRYKYYDHYGAIYYLFLDYLRQHHTIPIQEIQKCRFLEVIQQRQRNRKQTHPPVFQHSALNNSPGFDSISGYNKRLTSSEGLRHSYIQDSTKDLNALKDITLNSNMIFQPASCSALDTTVGNESRHKSPACYVHVINQQTIINNISPLLNFSTNSYTAKELHTSQLPLPNTTLLSQSYQPNISNSSHSLQNFTMNGINTSEYLQQYQDNHPQLNNLPSSLSSHSTKIISPTSMSYGSSAGNNASPNYSVVNSQFSSIINEMENLAESDNSFNNASYENATGSLKYSDTTDSLYMTDVSSRFSYPESSAGITAQYSNSTDEGVETDLEDSYQCQRLSYASSSSSSGVCAQNTSFSQNESCSSFHALTNQNSFENYKDKIKMDVTSSLPSCTATSNYITSTKTKKRKTPSACPSSWRRYSPLIHNQPAIYQFIRSGMKSPSDFREGRRASDGFVTQHEPKSKNMETSSLKESTSKETLYQPEYYHLTEKAKGFLELHELPKEHYDLKSLYDMIIGQDEELLRRQIYSTSYKSQYENKFKYPSQRSPTYSIRQNPYYEGYTKTYENADRDNVFLDANASIPNCKSPTKLHQKWQSNQKQGMTYSQLKTSGLPHNEMSPSKNRRKLFRQFKNKALPSTVPSLDTYADDIPTIIEDTNNGHIKHEDYRSGSTAISLQNETNQHITWNSTIPDSDFDLFQF